MPCWVTPRRAAPAQVSAHDVPRHAQAGRVENHLNTAAVHYPPPRHSVQPNILGYHCVAAVRLQPVPGEDVFLLAI